MSIYASFFGKSALNAYNSYSTIKLVKKFVIYLVGIREMLTFALLNYKIR